MSDFNPQESLPELVQSPPASCSMDGSPSREQPQPKLDSSTHKSDIPLAPKKPGVWRKTLFPELRPPLNFRLRFIPPTVRDEKTIGVCPKSAIEGELVILDLTLVGFFLGRRPSFSFVRSALLKQWKIQGNVEIIQMLQGGYAFRFSDIRDRDNILEGDSYFVGGQPMFLRAWERSLHTGGVLGLRKIPLWISLPGLPLHLWGEEALSSVCSVLGNPLYADKNTAMKSRLAFARVCVEFTASSPMLETITIEDELGLTYEQKVTYEWRPPHCLSCGVFGHMECAILEDDMEKEPLPREKEMNLESDRQGDEELLLQKSGFLPASLGRDFQENMKEVEEEAGWEQVRVRKKRPGLAGAPNTGQTRPGSQRSKCGQLLVSNSHWRARNPAATQVSLSELLPSMEANLNSKFCTQSASVPLTQAGKICCQKDKHTPPSETSPPVFLPNMGDFLNAKPCPQSVTGPLTPSKKGHCQNDKPTPPGVPCPTDLVPNLGAILNSKLCPHSESGPLTPARKASIPNDKPTPPSQPLEVPKLKECLAGEPIVAGSSAGHTPFPNRLASMARDLRRRQFGTPGLSKILLGQKNVGEVADGSKSTEKLGSTSACPKSGFSRNEHDHGLGFNESGNEFQTMRRMGDVEKMKSGNAHTSSLRFQGGCEMRRGAPILQNLPDSIEKINDMGEDEEYDPAISIKRGSRGERDKNGESGIGRADLL